MREATTFSRASLASYRIGIHLVVWPSILVLCGAVLFTMRGLAAFPVIVPLFLILLTAALFALTLIRRGTSPLFQIGGLFGIVLTLYGVYPLIAYLINGGVFFPGQDDRLQAHQPGAGDYGSIGLWYLALMVSFCISYLLTTSGTRQLRLRNERPANTVLVLLILAIAAIEAELFAFGLFFNMKASNYVDSYLVVQRLPMVPRQIYGLSSEFLPALQIFLLGALFSRYKKSWPWIVLLLLFIFLPTARGGARTQFFLAVFAATMFYHYLVRPIRLWVVGAGGVILLAAFIVLGIVRQRAISDHFSFKHITQNVTEFEVLFANVYDLRYIRHADGAFIGHPELYLTDLSALVPQQLLPFAKTTPSIWYLDTYYPFLKAQGAALAFGAVSEGVVGHGWPELILRGAALGLLFGLIHRLATRRALGYWGLMAYVWLTVTAYQSFRNTTFSLGPLFLFHFCLPAGLILFLSWLITPPVRRTGAEG